MVTPTTWVLAGTALASGALLLLLLIKLRALAKEMDGPGGARLLVAAGLLGGYVLIRFIQAFGYGTTDPVFVIRNGLWCAAWIVALGVVLTFPGATTSHRNAGIVLAVAAAPAGFLLPFWYAVVPHYLGLGALGAILAVLAWRLSGPTATGVRALALTGAGLAVLGSWADALLLSGAVRGDPRMFAASRVFADTVFILLALFARPALRERVPESPRAVAAQATGP